jgi:hypothetical protein
MAAAQGFDLDAFIASQAPGPFTFTFGGHEWVWPPAPDLRSLGYLEQGRIVDAFRLMFKPDDFERFMGETGGGLSQEAMVELFNRHAIHAGSSLGEASASPVSSVGTVRPSKRTSRSTTKSTSGRSSRKASGAA